MPYHRVMPNASKKTLLQIWQGLIRKWFWQMDIHPSAWIAPTALIDRTWPRGIHIGKDCVVDHQAVILTHDMTRGLYLDTVIGEGVYIGARAIVLPGIKIGRGARIEAGAIVLKDVDDGAWIVGNPARPMAESKA